VLNGVIDLILACVIFAGLPGTEAWALGLLVGVDLVFGGMALITMALHDQCRSCSTQSTLIPKGDLTWLFWTKRCEKISLDCSQS
jgi:hypothetical protein